MSTIVQIGLIVLASALPFAASAAPETGKANNEKTWTGTLTTVNPQDNTITGKWWWFAKTFHIGQQCAISTVDRKDAALSDLRPGEKAQIHYQNVEGVLVANRIDEKPMYCSGTIETIGPKAQTVTITKETVYSMASADKTFNIAADCKVVLRNGKDGVLDDVKPGDRVTAVYELPNGSPVVYRILEKSTTFVGKLEAVDLPARTAKASEFVGGKKFNLADNCQIIVNGKNAALTDLKLGQNYIFTYEIVNGVNVADRIAQTMGPRAGERASTR